MRWSLGLLLWVTGCDFLFQLDHVPPPDGGDVNSDVMSDSSELDLPAFCTAPLVFDPFDAEPACSWGVVDSAGTHSIHDGVIDFQLMGNETALVGCTAYTPQQFTPGGVFLHVTRPLMVQNGYTTLHVREVPNTTPTLDVAITSDGTHVTFFVNGIQQAQTTLHGWWRIRRPAPGVVEGYVSDDGTNWVMLASINVQTPTQMTLDIGAGVYPIPAGAGMATFSSFGICN